MSQPHAEWVLFSMGAFFVGVLGVLYKLWRMNDAYASKSWLITPGEITESRKKKHTHRQHGGLVTNTSYTFFVRYTFSVKGKTYEGFTHSFAPDHLSFSSQIDNLVRKYPVGKKVDVSYKTNYPQKSVLEPGGEGNAIWALLFFLALALGGAYGFSIYGLR